jgi:hypothetical protein
MEDMDQMDQSVTTDEYNQLRDGLEELLGTNHGAACLDDEEDCQRVATGVADWLMLDKTFMASPERFLPKALHRLRLNIADEITGEHIIRLTLDRTREMEDADFLRAQKVFWSVIGRAILDNPEVIHTLQSGGVCVEVGLLDDPDGEQHAP